MDVRVGPQRKQCRRTDAFKLVLENTLESPLDNRKIKSINLKGNLPCILFGRTDTETEVPILRPPDANT